MHITPVYAANNYLFRYLGRHAWHKIAVLKLRKQLCIYLPFILFLT